ncbi:MAG TPA: hypothetical protein ENO03_03235 [Candidatus Aminicenantes bacterium]|nr:hypothetical protein [Candidatus Aminicenantes bacterium]HDT13351.1 hypothetical protein [Candidatus Aminicenantes bacterium]
MNKVRAPEGFEAAVLARLSAARVERARARRRALARYALAGSAALILAAVLLVNPSLFEKETILTDAERTALQADPAAGLWGPSFDRSLSVPVYETMDYASEFRNVQSQPRTVYILEQVSEIRSSEIIF